MSSSVSLVAQSTQVEDTSDGLVTVKEADLLVEGDPGGAAELQVNGDAVVTGNQQIDGALIVEGGIRTAWGAGSTADLNLTTGGANEAPSKVGDVVIATGHGAGTAGDVQITTGSGGYGYYSGTIEFFTGGSVYESGNLIMRTGDAFSAGSIEIAGGDSSHESYVADVIIRGGDSAAAQNLPMWYAPTDYRGGDVTISGGQTPGNPDGKGGSIFLDVFSGGEIQASGPLVLVPEGSGSNPTSSVALQLNEVTSDGVLRTHLDTISSSADAGVFSWGYNDGLGGKIAQMQLDSENRLSLFGPDASPAQIVLDPDSASPSISIAGEEVLTKSYADRLYMNGGVAVQTGLHPNTVVIGGGGAYGVGSVALTGGYADGTYSIAAGGSYVTGVHSVALGGGSYVGGNTSVALGNGHGVYGNESVALGSGGVTTGDYATVTGLQNTASHGQFVIGRYNVAQGSSSEWVSSDDLFIIGNGDSPSSRSNAFVVNKSGSTWIGGSVSSAGASAGGTNSVAFGSGSADGNNSFAFGTHSDGDNSFSFGTSGGVSATANHSFSFGLFQTVTASSAFAAGTLSEVSGQYGTAFGQYLQVSGYNQFVVGRNNVAQGDTASWIDSDDLFIVGNGVDSANRSNAITIKKNGDLTAEGKIEARGGIRTAQMGDISMGSFMTSPTGLGDPALLDDGLSAYVAP